MCTCPCPGVSWQLALPPPRPAPTFPSPGPAATLPPPRPAPTYPYMIQQQLHIGPRRTTSCRGPSQHPQRPALKRTPATPSEKTGKRQSSTPSRIISLYCHKKMNMSDLDVGASELLNRSKGDGMAEQNALHCSYSSLPIICTLIYIRQYLFIIGR